MEPAEWGGLHERRGTSCMISATGLGGNGGCGVRSGECKGEGKKVWRVSDGIGGRCEI